MNVDLVRAIKEKRLIEFVYRIGQPRIAEPHDYGVRNGVESLLVVSIQQLRVLDRRFPGTRADASQHHRAWDTLFARVT